MIYGFRIEQAVDNNTSGHAFMIHAGRDESTRHTVLIHSCHFDQKSIFNYSIEVGDNGVIIWGCSFIGSGSPAVQGLGGISFVCNHADYKSYNRPSTVGTLDPDGVHNSYVEDCSFKNAATATVTGARAARLNTLVQDRPAGHGPTTGQTGGRSKTLKIHSSWKAAKVLAIFCSLVKGPSSIRSTSGTTGEQELKTPITSIPRPTCRITVATAK